MIDRTGNIELDEIRQFFKYLFTKSHSSKIIILTRMLPVITELPTGVCQEISIEGLEEKFGIELMCLQGADSAERKTLSRIHRRFEGHSLALVVIGQLCKKGYPAKKIEKFSIRIIEQKTEEAFLQKLLTELWPLLSRMEKNILITLSIYRTFVTEDAIQYFYSNQIDSEVIFRLVNSSLIKRQKQSGVHKYSIHSLLREYILEDLNVEQKQSLHLKAARYWESLEWVENPTKFNDLRERLEYRWHCYQAGNFEKSTKIALNLSVYLYRFGLYDLALNLLNEVIEKNVKGEELAVAYNNIGKVQSLQGDYTKALFSFKQAKKILGLIDNDIGIAKTFNLLGGTYYHQEKYDTALNYFKKVLKIKIPLENQTELSISYNGIALIYANRGQYRKALKFCNNALKIDKEVGNKFQLAITHNSLGYIHMIESKYEESLKNYYKARDIWEFLGCKVHFAMTILNIGNIYMHRREFVSAINYYKQAQEIFLKSGSLRELAKSYMKIGAYYFIQGNNADAMSQFAKASAILERFDLTEESLMKKLSTYLE